MSDHHMRIDDRHSSIGNVIDVLHRALQAAESRVRLPYNLTSRQFIVMRAIAVYGDPPNQATLTERTGMDRSTLASVLRLLDDRKLVRRVRDKEDRRNLRVTLTESGRQRLDEARTAIADVEQWITATLGSRHRACVDGLTALATARFP